MAESRKGRDRQVRLDYAFDRLLASKLQHVRPAKEIEGGDRDFEA